MKYPAFQFQSDIEVDDPELAYELLKATLDDERYALLETATRYHSFVDEEALGKGNVYVYSVITMKLDDEDDEDSYVTLYHHEYSFLREAIWAYNDEFKFREGDRVVIFRCQEQRRDLPLNEEDEMARSEAVYEAFAMCQGKILASFDFE